MNFTIAALMGAAVVTASEGGPYNGPSYGRRGPVGPAPYGRGPAPLGRGPAPYGRGPAPYGRGPAPLGLGPAPLGLGPKGPLGRAGPLGYGKLPGFATKKAAPVKKVLYKDDDYYSDDAAYGKGYGGVNNKIPFGGPARGGYAGRGRLGGRGAPYGGPGPLGRGAPYGGPGPLGRGAPYGGPGPVRGYNGPKGAHFGPGRLGLGKKAYADDVYTSESDYYSDDHLAKKIPAHGAKQLNLPPYGGPRKAPYGGPAYGRAPYGRAPYGKGPAPYAGPKHVADVYTSESDYYSDDYNVAPKTHFGGKPAYAGPVGPHRLGPNRRGPYTGPGPLPYGAPVKKVVHKAPLGRLGGYASDRPAFKLPAYGAKGPAHPVLKPKPHHSHGLGLIHGHKGHRVSHSVVPFDPHALKVSNKADLGRAPYGLGARGPVNGPGNKGAYALDQQPRGYAPNKNGTYNLNNNAGLGGVRALNTKPDPRGINDVRGFGGLGSVKGSVNGLLGKGYGGASNNIGYNFAAAANYKRNVAASPFPKGFAFKPSYDLNSYSGVGPCGYDGPCAFGGVTKKNHGGPKGPRYAGPSGAGAYGAPKAPTGYGGFGPSANRGYNAGSSLGLFNSPSKTVLGAFSGNNAFGGNYAFGAPQAQKFAAPFFKSGGAFGNYGTAFGASGKSLNQKPAEKPEIKEQTPAWAGPAWPTQDKKPAGAANAFATGAPYTSNNYEQKPPAIKFENAAWAGPAWPTQGHKAGDNKQAPNAFGAYNNYKPAAKPEDKQSAPQQKPPQFNYGTPYNPSSYSGSAFAAPSYQQPALNAGGNGKPSGQAWAGPKLTVGQPSSPAYKQPSYGQYTPQYPPVPQYNNYNGAVAGYASAFPQANGLPAGKPNAFGLALGGPNLQQKSAQGEEQPPQQDGAYPELPQVNDQEQQPAQQSVAPEDDSQQNDEAPEEDSQQNDEALMQPVVVPVANEAEQAIAVESANILSIEAQLEALDNQIADAEVELDEMKAANDEDEPMDLADLQNARLNYAAQGLGLEDLIDIFDADTAATAE